jgi:predicted dienelactone hydrolase
MYALEAVFLLVTAAWLAVTAAGRAPRGTHLKLFAAGAIAAALAFALGQARIHMAPGAAVFLILALLLAKRGYSHVAVRTAGAVLGATLVAASVLLAFALPVVTLPAPDGPHAVGVTSFNLIDASRDETEFGEPGRPREIYVQAWYPAVIPQNEAAPEPRSLWAELSRPPVLNVLFGYLRGIATHSYDGLPLAPERDSYPEIVFSPSLGGIAEQNTLLMEHLASHGYIVLAVTHPYFGAFMARSDGTGVGTSAEVMEAMSEQGAVDLDEIMARAERAATPLERARIRLEYFDRGVQLTEFVDTWVGDLGRVLDAITMGDGLPALLAGHVDSSRIGLMGMSYGGGAVTALCKEDARCRAVVNLDGGLWGKRKLEPLTVPYLAVASQPNADFFEHGLLTSEAPFYAITVAGVEHTNFMDVSVLAPVLEWLGVLGPIEGERALEIMNVLARGFFDAHLNDASPGLELELTDFPELAFRTNAARAPLPAGAGESGD